MPKLKFEKTVPYSRWAHSYAVNAAVMDSVRYLDLSDWLLYKRPLDTVAKIANISFFDRPFFVNGKVIYKASQYDDLSVLDINTGDGVPLVTLFDLPQIKAISAFSVQVSNIVWFKNQYHIFFARRDNNYGYVIRTPDFVSFSDVTFISTSFARVACVTDDAIVVTSTARLFITADGVTYVEKIYPFISGVFPEFVFFNGVYYAIGRISNNDAWLYKSLDLSAWDSVHDLVGLGSRFYRHADMLEIATGHYETYYTAPTYYLRISEAGAIAQFNTPYLSTPVPYTNGAVVSFDVGTEHWLVLATGYDVETGNFLCTRDAGGTWEPFIELPPLDKNDAATVALYTGRTPSFGLSYKNATINKGSTAYVALSPYTVALIDAEGTSYVRVPNYTSVLASDGNGGLFAAAITTYVATGAFEIFWQPRETSGWTRLNALIDALLAKTPYQAYVSHRMLSLYRSAENDTHTYLLGTLNNGVACLLIYDKALPPTDLRAWTVYDVPSVRKISGAISSGTLGLIVQKNKVVVSYNETYDWPDPSRRVVFTSTDSGRTFVETYNAPDTGSFGAVEYDGITDDGKKLIMGSAGLAIVSNDGGYSWSQAQARVSRANTFAEWIVPWKNGFLGFTQYGSNAPGYIYSNDGFTWYENQEDTLLYSLTAYMYYGALDYDGFTHVQKVGDSVLMFAEIWHGIPHDEFPDGGLWNWPFFVSYNGFWTDFVNCVDV